MRFASIAAALTLLASSPGQANELIYFLLPPGPAHSLRSAKEGVPLPAYERAFLAWTLVNLSHQNCELFTRDDARNAQLISSLSLQFSLFEDAIAAMRAQFNFKDLEIPTRGCGSKLGRQLADELVDVLNSDNAMSAKRGWDAITGKR